MSASRHQLSEDWDVVFREFEDGSAVTVFTNIALTDQAPLAYAPTLIRLDLDARTDRGNGFPDRDEFDDVFYPLEEALNESLGKIDPNLVFAGRATSGKALTFLFYGSPAAGLTSAKPGGMLTRLFGSKSNGATSSDDCADPRLAVIAAAIQRWPTYTIRTHIKDDPNWDAWRAYLAPDAEELSEVLDRRVLRFLQEHGDNVAVARDIDHFLIFPDAASRDEMAEIGQELGFTATPERTQSGAYSVELVRKDALEDIAEVSGPLRAAAEKLGGEYDGWGCPVAGSDK